MTRINTRPVVLLLFLAALLSLIWPKTAQANVDLLYFRSESSNQEITLLWETGFELDNLGFYIHRNTNGNFASAQLISPLLPGSNSVSGSIYEFIDSGAQIDTNYTYWLEDIDLNGSSTVHEPIQASLLGGDAIVTSTPAPAATTSLPATTTASPTATLASSVTPLPETTSAVTLLPPATFTPQAASSPLPSDTPQAQDQPLETNMPPPTALPIQNTIEPPVEEIDAGDGNGLPGGSDEEVVSPVSATGGSDDEAAVSAIADSSDLVGNPLEEVPIGADSSSPSSSLAAPIDAQPAAETASDSGNSSAVVMVLLLGLTLSVSGGAATWYLLRRGPR